MVLKPTFLLLLLGLILQILPAQSADKRYDADRLEPGSIMIKANYQTSFEKTRDGAYILKICYPETRQITHFITFRNKKASIKHGHYQEWFDNGNLWKIGQYEDGIATGKWFDYSYRGSWEVGTLKNGERTGKWDGYRSDTSLSKTMHYLDGKLDGVKTEFDSTGIITSIKTYKNDSLVSVDFTIDESDNTTTEMLTSEELPIMLSCATIEDLEERKKCSQSRLLNSIYTNVKYPRDARSKGYEGNARISFVIGKDGSVSEITTLRGVSRSIEKECYRVIKKLPVWQAGKQLGEPVRVQFTLPINFKLE